MNVNIDLMIMAAIMSFTIIINCFVLIVFLYRRNLLRTPSNRLLLSFACCDLLSGFGVIFRIVIHIIPDCHNNNRNCIPARVVIDILVTFLVECIVLHLCAITLDRFISVFYSLRYKSIVTSSRLKRCIILCWLVSFFSSAIQLTWLYPFVFNTKLTPKLDKKISVIEFWFSISSLILFHFVPLVLLSFAFLSMFFEIRKLIMNRSGLQKDRTRSKVNKQKRVCYTFGTMFLFFNVLTLPYFTMRLVADISEFIEKPIEVHRLVYKFVYVLKIVPSCINPIVYITFNHDFRLSIQKIYRQRKVELELYAQDDRLFTHCRKISRNVLTSLNETQNRLRNIRSLKYN